MTARRSVWPNVVLLIFSSLVALIAAETILRVIYPKPKKNQVLSIEYRHGWVFNAQGFRDEDFEAKLRRGRENLVFLGDSFTEGLGVERERSFAYLLAQKLKARYETFNLGKSATGTTEQTKILEKHLEAIRPKAVLLFFFWNDLQDNFNKGGDDSIQPLRVAESQRQRPFFSFLNPLKPMLSKTLLYHYISLNYRVMLAKLGLCKLDAGLELDLFEINSASPAVRIAWDNTDEALLALRELCRRRSAELYVVYVPKREQINRWQNLMRFYRVDESRYDRFLANRRLGDFCRENGIPFIDVTQEMDALPDKALFYYQFDSHLTALGNKRYFEKIEEPLVPLLRNR